MNQVKRTVWLRANFVDVVVHDSSLLTRMPKSQCLSEKGVGTPLIECTGFGGTVEKKKEKISQQHISQHVGKVANRDTMSLVRQCLFGGGITITSNLLDELAPSAKR